MRYLLFILLMISTECFAASGVRPNAAADTAVTDNMSFPADLPNSTTAIKATGQGMTNYIRSKLSGELAPQTHVHPFANTSTASGGFMSPTDKTRVDALYDASVPNSKTEGAVGDGNWHSLASHGYTDYTQVQADFPYVTDDGTLTGNHLITSNAMLTTHSMDWIGLQSCVYKSAATVGVCRVPLGTYILERTVNISRTVMQGDNENKITYRYASGESKVVFKRHTSYNSYLLTANTGAIIRNISIQSIYGITISGYGINISANSVNVKIDNCYFLGLDICIYTNNTVEAYIENNYFNSFNYIVYVGGSSGTATLNISKNISYNEGYTGGSNKTGVYVVNNLVVNLDILQNKFYYVETLLYVPSLGVAYHPQINIKGNHIQAIQGGDYVIRIESSPLTVTPVLINISDNFIQAELNVPALFKIGRAMVLVVRNNTTAHTASYMLEMVGMCENVLFTNNYEHFTSAGNCGSRGPLILSSLTGTDIAFITAMGNGGDCFGSKETFGLSTNNFKLNKIDKLELSLVNGNIETGLATITTPEITKITRRPKDSNSTYSNTAIVLYNPAVAIYNVEVSNLVPNTSVTKIKSYNNGQILDLNGSYVTELSISQYVTMEFIPLNISGTYYWVRTK